MLSELLGGICVVSLILVLCMLEALKDMIREERARKRHKRELRLQREKEEYALAVLAAYQSNERERMRQSLNNCRRLILDRRS
ncbi:hypothetical protein BU202_08105 [Streptococcus cuniculi]|uniref:Uncharacterized protein n=1 Tax=Streptococcus cuniculi TaxID=1432788 RepID=A0A1Q8E653_9STRE|nr:hypothetical protein BU202_08105 [Streptococcus cuniculi]